MKKEYETPWAHTTLLSEDVVTASGYTDDDNYGDQPDDWTTA